MKVEIKNIQDSVHARLQNKAKETNRPFAEGPPLCTEAIYDETSDRQILWKAFLQKGQIQNAPQKLKEIARAIEDFLNHPIKAIYKNSAFSSKWKALGPWGQPGWMMRA